MGKTTAIIVAAGSSSRMGFDKIFARINDKPVLLYVLEAFQAAETIDGIIVVNNHADRIKEFASDITKLFEIVAGGKNRDESVQNGLNAISYTKGVVAVHDGARPLITPMLIDNMVNAGKAYKAAIPAIAVRDTVKQIKGGYVEYTPDRETMYAAQTPQVFDLELYRKAIGANHSQTPTDDSAVLERAGVKVKIVEGDYSNIKITSPEDLKIAKMLINEGT
ncbi:MAG: 2-C-methyl-D-erythritol 4-phosphate cytidylyltransferase [Oscillospiraceae bacterium]|nr:2-C-methyl-D-erythritol 4-phosphate cytidylyltransferase [Oscillospiraceae bacterium]